MNAPERIIDRRTFLGGSDVAAVLGLSPWATPLDIYLRKTGQMPETGRESDPQRERVLKRGKRLEPIVVDMLIEEHGIQVTKRSLPEAPNRYVDPEYGFLAAEIDFEWKVTPEVADAFNLDADLIGTIQNGEVKTVHPFAAGKFGEADTDEIPIEYAAQAMHGLMVSGRQLTMFGVLVGADNLNVYWIKRDEETITGMRDKSVRFWLDHVEAGVPPAPANLPDVMHLFNRKAETRIEANAVVKDLVEQLVGLSAAQATAAQGIEEVKFQIGTYMLGAEQMAAPSKPGRHLLTYQGKELLTVALQSQSRLDQKALKEKHPEIAAECMKTASFFAFRPKRGKQ